MDDGRIYLKGLRGRKNARKILVLHPNKINGFRCNVRVRCRNGRHFIPELPDLVPFQGKIILDESDSDLRCIIAGNNRPDPRQLLGPGRIDMFDFRMGTITEFNFAVQHSGARHIMDIHGLSGRFVRGIGPGGFRTDKTKLAHIRTSSPFSSFKAACLMDSTICTYPVHRQRFPEIPFRISSSVG